MTLKELQQQFQSHLLNNDDAVVEKIQASKNLSAQLCLNIYKNSYVERIIDALSQDYPVLKAHLGNDAFASLIRDYLKKYPSTHFNLRFVGKQLPHFILSCDADFLPYAELARLEWLYCESDMDGATKMFESEFNVLDVWRTFRDSNQLLPLRRLTSA